jgi:hypothetical protein
MCVCAKLTYARRQACVVAPDLGCGYQCMHFMMSIMMKLSLNRVNTCGSTVIMLVFG